MIVYRSSVCSKIIPSAFPFVKPFFEFFSAFFAWKSNLLNVSVYISCLLFSSTENKELIACSSLFSRIESLFPDLQMLFFPVSFATMTASSIVAAISGSVLPSGNERFIIQR